MKLPRDLSGERLIRHLCNRCGYRCAGQVGSHVVLEIDRPSQQRLVVPAHRSVRVGTLNAILLRVAAHKNAERSAVLKEL